MNDQISLQDSSTFLMGKFTEFFTLRKGRGRMEAPTVFFWRRLCLTFFTDGK